LSVSKRKGDQSVAALSDFRQERILQAVGIGLYLTLRNLFICGAMEAQLANSKPAALVAYRRSEDSTSHRSEFVKIAASGFGIEGRTHLFICKIEESLLCFSALIKDSRVRIARKLCRDAINVRLGSSLNSRRTRRIYTSEFCKPVTQASSIQGIDRESANAALRASEAAGQPGTCPAACVIECGIDDLHEFAISDWTSARHCFRITQILEANKYIDPAILARVTFSA
jgi:hypothetical protein